MKLELKHLAPYLPHGLKIRRYTKIEEQIGTENQEDVIEMSIDFMKVVLKNDHSYFDCKPILKPLSDLTKVLDWFVDEKGGTIDFIENEKAFWQISMAPAGGIRTYETNFLILEPLEKDEEPCICLQTVSDDNAVNETELLRYDQMMFLIERHYDVFGLIDKGLAIDTKALAKEKDDKPEPSEQPNP